MKRFLRSIALCSAFATSVCVGQAFPTRPVSLIVPSAPGGTTDITARLLSEPLGRALKQSVIVDNRAGGSGNVGLQIAARSKPDGHTLLMQYSGIHVTNPWLYKNPGWNPTKDFVSIGMALVAPHVFVVHPSLPVKSLAELGALARSRAGALTYASSGLGSIQHIGTELFLQMTNAKMVHVPYKGAGPAVVDLVAGHVTMFNTTPPSTIGFIRSGKLRALAYLAKDRHPALKDIPTSAESGLPGYEVDAWFAMFAPTGTPLLAIDRLSSEVSRIVGSPEFKQKAEEQGAFAKAMEPKVLDGHVQVELERWGKVIKAANISAE